MAQQDHFGPTCEIISKGRTRLGIGCGGWRGGFGVEGGGGDGMFVGKLCDLAEMV